jgi:hypothetical protein
MISVIVTTMRATNRAISSFTSDPRRSATATLLPPL